MKDSQDDSRAQRRHERARLLKNRRRYHGRDYMTEGDAKARGALAKTPAPCSCAMCGNPRRYFGEQTIAERSWKQKKLDE